MKPNWLIYGANGYTGELTARLAAQRGLGPILADRNATRIAQLATQLGLDYRIFGLEDHERLKQGLQDIGAVLHMAGPFSWTSKSMIDACMETGTHYLDITGEIDIFESIFARSQEAESKGVVLIPGVGFDVVPTDCLSAMLKEKLPDATSLELAFHGSGGSSRGTLKTMIEGLAKGGRARLSGEIVVVPMLWKRRSIPFPSSARSAVTIPWGDVSTAFHSTGIENICVYLPISSSAIQLLKVTGLLKPIIASRAFQVLMKQLVEWMVSPPAFERQSKARSEIWGEVCNADGDKVSGTMTTPAGYALTAEAAIAAVQRVLQGEVRPGAHTPSRAFGADFITTLSGVEIHSFQLHDRLQEV